MSDWTADTSTINFPQNTTLVSFLMDDGSEMLEYVPCKIIGCAEKIPIFFFFYIFRNALLMSIHMVNIVDTAKILIFITKINVS